MTNILILALQLSFTNTTGVGATTYSDSFFINGTNALNGGWSADYCWAVTMTYTAPPGVYRLQWDYDPMLPAQAVPNGWVGINPELLNPPFTNYTQTNTITFPMIPNPIAFFRLKQVQTF